MFEHVGLASVCGGENCCHTAMVRDLNFYSSNRQHWPAALRERERFGPIPQRVWCWCVYRFRAGLPCSQVILISLSPPPSSPLSLSASLLARERMPLVPLSLAIAVARSDARALSPFEEDDSMRKTTFNPAAKKKKIVLTPSLRKGFR